MAAGYCIWRRYRSRTVTNWRPFVMDIVKEKDIGEGILWLGKEYTQMKEVEEKSAKRWKKRAADRAKRKRKSLQPQQKNKDHVEKREERRGGGGEEAERTFGNGGEWQTMASPVQSVAAASLNLPFQVLLHLHAHLTPFAITSQIGCFLLKFRFLYPTYRATLLALHFVSVLVQIARPFLAFHGNLKGRIPSLSAFWILTALLHLPTLLFLGFNSDIRPLPLERFFYLVDFAFSSIELLIATFLIRRLANKQMELISKMMEERRDE